MIDSSSNELRKDQIVTPEKKIISNKLSYSQDLFHSLSNHSQIKSCPSFEITSKPNSIIDSNEINPSGKLQD